jgi:predicted nucleotidyltransferase
MNNEHPYQPTLDELLETLKSQMPSLAEDYHVRSLGIFGPYATRKARPRSYLGLLVQFDQAPSMFTFMRLERHLSKLVAGKVVLVFKDTLRPEIGKRVMKELVPV